MGRHYARIAGEHPDVCDAIADHYAPRGAADRPPRSLYGALVGVADKIDTLVGCFAVGLAPSGSADPYGLRRAALGVLTTLLDRDWRFPLGALIDDAAGQLDHFGKVKVDADDAAELLDFFKARLRGVLVDGNTLAADCVDGALAVGFENVVDARARAAAVALLRARNDFEPLAVAFKRVANIIKGERVDAEPDPDRFREAEERSLWEAFLHIRGQVDAHLAHGEYQSALRVLTDLKEPVDRFFDKVLVMDKDEAIRANRLALLGRVNAAFTRIADFRLLAV
jgi:glycyl-tRNA synthetase beta chain